MDVLVTALHSSLVCDALGQRTQYTHPNGMRTEYAYDTWNRLEGIYHKDATTNAVLDSFEYTLNDGNEITRIDHADGGNWRYTYDDRGRLYWAVRYSNGDTLSDWYQYTYDDGDNMTQYWRYYASTQTFDTWDFAYNAANQQTSMTLNSGTAETRTYDDWGRMTARAQGSYSAAYSYRYGDRLRQVTSSFPGETATSPVYEYGGDGKMRRRGTEEIRYGLGFNPVAERTNTFMTKYFVYEPGKAVSERLAYFGGGFDTSQHYYNHDHLGNVRRTRTSIKGSVAVWDYEPYGKVRSGSAPFIFALHPYESGMRMYHAPYRNYSPAMARWTTVDPAGMVDGPNMYGYVVGNPVNYIDLFGKQYWPPFPDPAGSSESCCEAAKRLGDAIGKQYPYDGCSVSRDGFRDRRDHMRHCSWNCEITKAQGRFCAWAITSYYEYFKSDNDPFDYESNKRGRKCGEMALSCTACCANEADNRVGTRIR